MAKGSENDFPHAIFVEQASAPATPAAGAQKIFIDDSDHHLKRVDEADAVVDIEAGGSGNATTTSAYASPPGAPAEGDVWFPNDSFYVLRYNGAAQAPWGPIFPLTPPPAVGDFTWVNQGTSTAVETYGGISMVTQAASGDSIRLLAKAATAPYAITAMLMGSGVLSGASYGIGFRQSSDGKLHLLMLGGSNGGVAAMFSIKFNTPTAFSATYAVNNFSNFVGPMPPRFVRIADDNSNRILSWSSDGINFTTYHTIGRTDFLTANQVCFFANAASASVPAVCDLISWKQT